MICELIEKWFQRSLCGIGPGSFLCAWLCDCIILIRNIEKPKLTPRLPKNPKDDFWRRQQQCSAHNGWLLVFGQGWLGPVFSVGDHCTCCGDVWGGHFWLSSYRPQLHSFCFSEVLTCYSFDILFLKCSFTPSLIWDLTMLGSCCRILRVLRCFATSCPAQTAGTQQISNIIQWYPQHAPVGLRRSINLVQHCNLWMKLFEKKFCPAPWVDASGDTGCHSNVLFSGCLDNGMRL